MKKSTKTISALFAMLLMALVSPAAAFAQWSWHDDFGDYVTGADLVGNGNWWQYSSSAVNPVKVGEGPLTYEGYPGGVTGKSITLAPSNSQRVYTVFNDYWNGLEKKESVRGITTGSVYYSMLLNVKSAMAVQYANQTPYLASFVTCNTKPLADKGSGMEKGKFYVKADADGTGYVLGVNPTGAPMNLKFTESLEYGKTYLVVVKYTLDGDLKGKDGMSLFVNPADFKTEPAPTADVPVGTGTGG